MQCVPTKTVRDRETGLWCTGNARLGIWAQGKTRAKAQARFPRLLAGWLAACTRQGALPRVLARLS